MACRTATIARGGVLMCLLAALATSVGCAGRKTPPEMLRTNQPRTLQVLGFTGPSDWTLDGQVDGLALVLQPQDHFRDPVKAVGDFRLELYQYRIASADRRGERLGVWSIAIDSPQKQKQYWDTVLNAYRFQLVTLQEFRPEQKFILEIVYQSPFDERTILQYELEIEATAAGDAIVTIPPARQ